MSGNAVDRDGGAVNRKERPAARGSANGLKARQRSLLLRTRRVEAAFKAIDSYNAVLDAGKMVRNKKRQLPLTRWKELLSK